MGERVDFVQVQFFRRRDQSGQEVTSGRGNSAKPGATETYTIRVPKRVTVVLVTRVKR